MTNVGRRRDIVRANRRAPEPIPQEKRYESGCGTPVETCCGLAAGRRRDPQDEQRQDLRKWLTVTASQPIDQRPKVKTVAARCVV